jgi:hypothetical protein
MIRVLPSTLLLLLCAGLACAQPEAPASRFIPLQLIIGDVWNGERSVT